MPALTDLFLFSALCAGIAQCVVEVPLYVHARHREDYYDADSSAARVFTSPSDDVARFIRLPDGYSFVPSTSFLSQTRVTTLKDCGITATIAELKSGNVGGYIFSQSGPNCEVYTSVVKIAYDGYSGGSDAWYVKIPDDVTYEGKCADQDVMRLVEAINSTYAVTTTSTSPTTPLPKYANAPDPSKHANVNLDYASPMTVEPLGAKATLSCRCTSNNVLTPGIRYEFWRTGEGGVPSPDRNDTNGVKITCENKADLCILRERTKQELEARTGQEWISGSTPPDYLVLYPFCESSSGCHMYIAIYRNISEIVSGESPQRSKRLSEGNRRKLDVHEGGCSWLRRLRKDRGQQ